MYHVPVHTHSMKSQEYENEKRMGVENRSDQ